MGIRNYNCAVCERIFPDVDDHGRCGYCDTVWCDWCSSSVHRFIYNGRSRCDFCWDDEPEPAPAESLLEFALDKLDMDRQELEQEWLKTAPARYHNARDVAACVRCKTSCASSKCERVGLDFYPDEPASNDDSDECKSLDCYRGYCCAAQGKALWERCQHCQEWWNQRTAVALIGLRTKRQTPFSELPRDVLRHSVIEPWVLPAEHVEPQKEKPKNKPKRRKTEKGRK